MNKYKSRQDIATKTCDTCSGYGWPRQGDGHCNPCKGLGRVKYCTTCKESMPCTGTDNSKDQQFCASRERKDTTEYETPKTSDSENALRKLLFLHHNCANKLLYGDDGEMQCQGCNADFKRMNPKELYRCLDDPNQVHMHHKYAKGDDSIMKISEDKCSVCLETECDCTDVMFVGGDGGVECIDSANIPVDVWLTALSKPPAGAAEEDEETPYSESALYRAGYRWKLQFSFYLPRKDAVWSDGCGYHVAKERKPLADLIKFYILPMYKTAIKSIEGMIEKDKDSLYYWEE